MKNEEKTVAEVINIWPSHGVLFTIEWSDIPGNVVAPADSLNPVNGTRIDPHHVSRPLDEAVHWNVSIVEVL